jgi:hypothetical protein
MEHRLPTGSAFPPLVGRSVLIVPIVADDWMLAFLDANVDSLPKRGEPK